MLFARASHAHMCVVGFSLRVINTICSRNYSLITRVHSHLLWQQLGHRTGHYSVQCQAIGSVSWYKLFSPKKRSWLDFTILLLSAYSPTFCCQLILLLCRNEPWFNYYIWNFQTLQTRLRSSSEEHMLCELLLLNYHAIPLQIVLMTRKLKEKNHQPHTCMRVKFWRRTYALWTLVIKLSITIIPTAACINDTQSKGKKISNHTHVCVWVCGCAKRWFVDINYSLPTGAYITCITGLIAHWVTKSGIQL